MTEAYEPSSTVAAGSGAMVALNKEQFGRGPTKARTFFAGPDAMITVLEDALLPAEKAMVAMGESLRVQEARAFMQHATKDRFVQSVEQIVYRNIRSFQSACDPETGIIIEISVFEPLVSDDAG